MQPRSVCGTFSRTARPPLRPNPFSASRVRVPGTAGGESSGLGPESDRRMPGTRPSCARRQASLVREVTCPVGHEKGRTGGGASRGPRERCLATATRAAENQGQRQGQHQRTANSEQLRYRDGHGYRPRQRPRPSVTATVTDFNAAECLVLRLAALRWRVAFVVLVRNRPPSGVSTACLVAVAHFSGTRFPRVPPSRMCPSSLEVYAAHSQGPHARRCAPIRSPYRVCGSRARLKENRPIFTRRATGGCPAPVPRAPGARRRRYAKSRAPWGTRRGAPVGGASRGPRERCLATAGRLSARRFAQRFQRRLASATRAVENRIR
jgi:hypothetical protein